MLNGKQVCVVLPAYRAAPTVAKTVAEVDRGVVDRLLLVDDASPDDTVERARALGLEVIRHDRNRGYGGNQKTCYAAALARGADVVVMLHPDYQYTPRLVTAMAAMVAYDTYDLVLGSRILGRGALAGGMPRWKYVSNRVLTLVENAVVGLKLSEFHSGYRAFSRTLLQSLNLEANDDGFVFDNQMVVQAHAAGFRIGEISCPTRYAADSSSVGFAAGVRYGLGVLRTALQYRAWRWGLARVDYLASPAEEPAAADWGGLGAGGSLGLPTVDRAAAAVPDEVAVGAELLGVGVPLTGAGRPFVRTLRRGGDW